MYLILCSDPLYIITYYIKWVTTSWTYSRMTDIARERERDNRKVQSKRKRCDRERERERVQEGRIEN